MNRKLAFAGGILGLFLFWKLLSLRIGSPILLPPPEEAFRQLGRLLRTEDFWRALGATTLRSLYGFTVSFLLGVLTGTLAGLVPPFRAFFRPALTVLRTIPVLALILLAMLWFVTDLVPVFVCFLMVYPLIFANVLEGILRVDVKLLEMSRIYGLGFFPRLFHILLPSLVPYLAAAANAGLGMAWKVTIAAEVLAQPARAVGTGIQWAQLNLETGEVLAWTAAAILLSGLSEGILGLVSRRLAARRSL